MKTKLLALGLVATMIMATFVGYAQTSNMESYTAILGGKKVVIPLTYESHDGHMDGYVYEYKGTWKEKDTTYIFRSYYLYHYKEKDSTETCVQDVFILSHNKKGHVERCVEMSAYNDFDFNNPTQLGELIEEFDNFKGVKLQHFDLGNTPRKWYHVTPYQGKYYFSFENPWVEVFNDSLYLFMGMDIGPSPLLEFKSEPGGGCRYTVMIYPYENPINCRIVPSTKVKGLYVSIEYFNDGEPTYMLLCPEENLKYFDYLGLHFCELDDQWGFIGAMDEVDYEWLIE